MKKTKIFFLALALLLILPVVCTGCNPNSFNPANTEKETQTESASNTESGSEDSKEEQGSTESTGNEDDDEKDDEDDDKNDLDDKYPNEMESHGDHIETPRY